MKQTVRLGVVRVLFFGAVTLGISGCGLIGGSPAPTAATPAPSPTLLPPPRSSSSPEPGVVISPVALTSPTPSTPPTPVPPPDLNAKPQASVAAPTARAKVVNTEGQGANMRAEPAATGQLVRTVKEGTELELIGDEREAGGRTWRNVRDPGDNSTGWIVSDLLSPIAAAPVSAPAAAPASGASPSPAAKPPGEAKPAGEPKPSSSPPPINAPAGAAKPAQRIGDADRAYLGVLQEPMDTLGKAIGMANEQIERAGGKPDIAADPTWRKDTQGVIASLRDASTKVRAAKPGPSTAGVHRFATNAADRADEAADGLSAAIESGDTRNLGSVRTTLVKMLAEINNMNLSLLELQ